MYSLLPTVSQHYMHHAYSYTWSRGQISRFAWCSFDILYTACCLARRRVCDLSTSFLIFRMSEVVLPQIKHFQKVSYVCSDMVSAPGNLTFLQIFVYRFESASWPPSGCGGLLQRNHHVEWFTTALRNHHVVWFTTDTAIKSRGLEFHRLFLGYNYITKAAQLVFLS